MVEKTFKERNIIYLISALFLLICSFLVLPNIHLTSLWENFAEPASLLYLITILWVVIFFLLLFYVFDTDIYKIIGKKYLYGEKEEKDGYTTELWKEVKD
jgi:hypothetical protein